MVIYTTETRPKLQGAKKALNMLSTEPGSNYHSYE